MNTKPKVGDVMWRVYSSRSRQREEEVTVAKVGRKYVTVRGVLDAETEHEIETGRERGDYRGDYRVYASKQEWLDELEAHRIKVDLRHFFSMWDWNMTLEQLREIAKIVKSVEGKA